MSTLKVNNIQSFSDAVGGHPVKVTDDLHVQGELIISGTKLIMSDPIGAVNFSGFGADPGELFTLSGSQIFSSSAFPGGADPAKVIFNSAGFSSSLFVFRKPNE